MEIRGIACALMLGWASQAYSQPVSDEDLLLSFGDEEFVTIATGQRVHISKAPAVASVITAEDIRAMGATDISEVLETVPGLHVSVSAINYNPVFIMRGIYSEFNPQVLFLINGIPITHLQFGDRGQYWGGMPVESIARIEVLRGPGSAVYGADAYAGIINIITKTPNEIDDLKVGLRSGSFDTNDFWMLYGKKFDVWKFSSSFELHSTDGFKKIIEADFQTVFDGGPGGASLAPGPVNTGVNSMEARFDLSNEHWMFRLGYQNREDVGTGAGVAQALDPEGLGNASRLNFDVNYQNESLSKEWLYKLQLSYFDSDVDSDNLVLFPAGTTLPIGDDGNIAPGGGLVLFTDGVIGSPDVFENHLRLNFDTYYSGFERHNVRMGAGASSARLEATESKNFGPGGILNGVEDGTRDGILVDVTGTSSIFISNEKRDIHYLFLQDEWAFASDWKLTSGIRYDDYSDFGSTVNPRLALVWQTGYNFTTKLLYGEAFRPPSFSEQFNINNPVVLGNSDLDPEEINTIELVFDYTSNSGKVRNSINLFSYETKDIIRFVPDPDPATSVRAQNTAGQNGRGFEWEVRWDVNNKTRLSANYAFQNSEDKLTGADVANAPGRQFFVRYDHALSYTWKFQTQAKYIADRERAPTDLRPPVDDYTRVDTTIRYMPNSDEGVQFSLIVRNLLNEDIREPSLAPGFIVNDLPQAGRQVLAELRYDW